MDCVIMFGANIYTINDTNVSNANNTKIERPVDSLRELETSFVVLIVLVIPL